MMGLSMSPRFTISKVRIEIECNLDVAIFFLALGGPHRTLTVGEWTRNSSFLVPQPNIYERRKDLSGVTLINSVLPWEPVMIFEEGGSGIRNMDGFMYRLYTILQGVSRRVAPPRLFHWNFSYVDFRF